MTVHYSGRARTHEYVCNRLFSDYGGNRCQRVPGKALNQYITTQVLAALEPAALELSLQAVNQLEADRQALETLWQQRLERSAIEAERAGRHDQRVEPENRLVARQLAKDWEAKLLNQQQLQEDYQRFCAQQPHQLSEAERTAIKRLAHDIPRLWKADTTTQDQRKEIIRQVVNQIVVQTQGNTEKVKLTIEWTGGVITQHQITRPITKWEHLSFYPQLCERIRTLFAEGYNATAIATQLNQESFHTPRQIHPFKPAGVLSLMRRLGIYQRQPKGIHKDALASAEWWLPDLARALEIPRATLYKWIKRGWMRTRQQSVSPYRLIIWADDAEMERLKQLHQRSYSDRMRQKWLATEVSQTETATLV